MNKIQIPKELLYQEYIINKKSYTKIAKEFGYKPDTVRKRLKDNGIPIRSSSEAQLHKKINHKQNCQCFICRGIRGERFGEKAPMFNKGYLTCGKNNVMYGVHRFGKDSPHWKGTSSLYERIRGLLEYSQWRTEVFERDNYTCQKCGKYKCYLESHHKKRFSIILSEFLKIYSQFSPMEDIETLVRLALNYQPFWDVDNGITLCKGCHNKTKKGHKI